MLYPLNIDISGRRCLVVGGGTVAARKAAALLECNAVVRVVSPTICASLEALVTAGRLEWLARPFEDHDVAGAFLAFAATDDPEVQERVAVQACRQGVLLNSAERPELSDFLVPAAFRRGGLMIAVSTGGSSPGLAAQIRDRLAGEFGPEYGAMVELLARIRQKVIVAGGSHQENRQLFLSLLERPIIDCIRHRDWTQLQGILKEVLPPGAEPGTLIDELERATAGEAT